MESWQPIIREKLLTLITHHHVFILLKNVKVSVLQGIVVILYSDCGRSILKLLNFLLQLKAKHFTNQIVRPQSRKKFLHFIILILVEFKMYRVVTFKLICLPSYSNLSNHAIKIPTPRLRVSQVTADLI